MHKWIVYRHTSPSGKTYIGITSNIKQRWASNGRNYCTYNSIFKKAIEKYGWDSIQHDIVLEGVSKSEAIYAEKYLIRWYKLHNLSYNITDGGEGTLGMKFSKERIQRSVNTKVKNNKVDYIVIDTAFNYILFDTVKEAAKYLGGEHSNISSVLKQPIGYTYKKHYILKHEKGTPVDIDSIKQCIQEALKQRHDKMSKSNKIASKKAAIARKIAIQAMTEEEKKVRFGHRGMLGKHHSAEAKKKMSIAAMYNRIKYKEGLYVS